VFLSSLYEIEMTNYHAFICNTFCPREYNSIGKENA